MHILVVEDDPGTAAVVTRGLRQAGYAVDTASDGEEGLRLATSRQYDALVLDIMLPGLDGLALTDTLRQQSISTPVIFLSAKSSVKDRIQGLHTGGDDYVTKPFAFSELLARIQTIVRRASCAPEPTTLTVGDLTMDLIRRKVVRSDTQLNLQPREFALLEYLVRNAGRVVSKTMIMKYVWNYNFDPQTNVVEVRMCRLRDKVDRPFQKPLIHTVRGAGYLLEARD